MAGKAASEAGNLYDLFIGGSWVPAVRGRRITMTAPSNGEAIGTIACGTAADIDIAVAAARSGFETCWRHISAAERGRILGRLARLISGEVERLADIEARDTGKPLAQARSDVEAAARYFEYYAGACDKIHGDIIPYRPGYTAMALREPLGVTGHILPWNYPAQQFGRTLGPSLAAGNTVVLKPAEEACLSILAMTELSAKAGFPPGVINVVPGQGSGAGSALAGHAGLDFISFTGSPEVGQQVQELSAANHIGSTLELGGKSPQILFDDADLDAAIEAVVTGFVQNAGQTCSACSRVLVHAPIVGEVIGRLRLRVQALRIGPHDSDPDCGPLISARQRDRVANLVAQAEAEGVPVICRREPPPDLPGGGFYFPVIVFGPVDPGARIAREEVFGPVLSLLVFADEAEAIALANGTDYGLVAAVWSRDAGRLMRVAREMRCGQVFMNDYGAGGGVELPFGGVKRSGHGREKGMEAIHEYSILKTLVHRHG